LDTPNAVLVRSCTWHQPVFDGLPELVMATLGDFTRVLNSNEFRVLMSMPRLNRCDAWTKTRPIGNRGINAMSGKPIGTRAGDIAPRLICNVNGKVNRIAVSEACKLFWNLNIGWVLRLGLFRYCWAGFEDIVHLSETRISAPALIWAKTHGAAARARLGQRFHQVAA
jgi:hypothetical protein